MSSKSLNTAPSSACCMAAGATVRDWGEMHTEGSDTLYASTVYSPAVAGKEERRASRRGRGGGGRGNSLDVYKYREAKMM